MIEFNYVNEVSVILRWRKRIRRMTYMMTDVICILLASIVANIVYIYGFKKALNITSLEHIGFFSISGLLFVGLYIMFGIYEDTIEDHGKLSFKTIVKMIIVYTIGTALLGAGLFYLDVSMSRFYIGTFVLLMMLFVLVNRLIMNITQFQDSDSSEAMRNILVVGQSPKGMAYIEEIRKHDYLNFNIVGYVSIKKVHKYDSLKHIGTIEALTQIAEDYVIDEIAVARPLSYDDRLKDALSQCQDMGITITMLLDIHNSETAKAQVAMVGSIPVLKFHTVSLNESQLFVKRMLDVLGGCVGMVFFGIAWLVLAPLIKLETPGPVIFKQDRVGKNGRVFKVWKFRSMGVNAEAEKEALMTNNEMSGHMFKMTADPRITKIGGFIRKTSLDELPQFYNVLKGDMSLVGTRPPTVNEVKAYEQHHRRRIGITPGITGNWQVSGRSDIEDFEEVVRLDSEYIENWSIWSDVRILFKTVWVVVAGRGSK